MWSSAAAVSHAASPCRSMSFNPDELAAHAGFIRALSLELLRDEHRAQDVVQETMIKALRARPSGHLRPWLARVARNLASNERRDGTRRKRREQASARRDWQQPDDSVARKELFREISAAVLELPDHLREAVFLKHYENLSSGEAAQRLSVSVSTFRARVREALSLLRQHLDRSWSMDRRRWTVPLAILVDSPRQIPGAKPSHVSSAVALKSVAVVVVVGLLGIAAFSIVLPDDQPVSPHNSELDPVGVSDHADSNALRPSPLAPIVPGTPQSFLAQRRLPPNHRRSDTREVPALGLNSVVWDETGEVVYGVRLHEGRSRMWWTRRDDVGQWGRLVLVDWPEFASDQSDIESPVVLPGNLGLLFTASRAGRDPRTSMAVFVSLGDAAVPSTLRWPESVDAINAAGPVVKTRSGPSILREGGIIAFSSDATPHGRSDIFISARKQDVPLGPKGWNDPTCLELWHRTPEVQSVFEPHLSMRRDGSVLLVFAAGTGRGTTTIWVASNPNLGPGDLLSSSQWTDPVQIVGDHFPGTFRNPAYEPDTEALYLDVTMNEHTETCVVDGALIGK